MVSIGDLDLWSVGRALARAAADDGSQPLHARAFASWIRGESPGHSQLLSHLAKSVVTASGARQSSDAAVLGYAVTIDREYERSFLDAVAWLRDRQYFMVGRPLGFEIDGLALLGVAVGLRSLDSDKSDSSMSWFKQLLAQSLSLKRPSDWNEALLAAAAEIVGILSAKEQVTSDLRLALSGRSLASATESDRASAWTTIAGLTTCEDGMTRASAQAAALSILIRHSSTLRTGNSTVEDVACVLAGVAKSMRRWAWEEKPRTPNSAAAKWVIDNEYHVQDLLWAILAPVFPDLDDEEWLKSLGQHHPRADLAIPSLRVIIEVKFAREHKKSFGEIIQEVAADASTYLQEGGPFTGMIAFVWDDAARTEEHAELRQGLLRLRGVVDAIVLPRPRRMVR